MNSTPGPWIAREVPRDDHDKRTSYFSHWIDSRDGKPIGEIRTYYNGESTGNANLIAQAPEMARILRMVQENEGRLSTGQFALILQVLAYIDGTNHLRGDGITDGVVQW